MPGKGGAARKGGARGDLYVQIGLPPAERPALTQDAVIRSPASRWVWRVVLAAAWLVLWLSVFNARAVCPAVVSTGAGCRPGPATINDVLLVGAVPLIIAAGAAAYAHVLLSRDGIRPRGVRALVLRRDETYRWGDIESVGIMTVRHKWTFFTVYVARHVELRVRERSDRVRLPAPKAGMLVSERQFQVRASVIHRTWLEQTGQVAGF